MATGLSKSSADDLDYFTCSICKDVYKNPVKISCGHTFCEDCIEKTWMSNANDPTCPCCRATIEVGEKTRDMEMLTKMSNKSTNCRRCNKFLVFTEYRRHERICGGNLTSSWTAGRTCPMVGVKNIYTFTCPYCQHKNLDRESLLKHVNYSHKDDQTQVVCPICRVMPWGNPGQKSQNFQDHINLRHRFDYDRFVDFNQDEETALENTIALSSQQS